MNAYAVRLGFVRGWLEFRQTLASSDQWFNVVVAAAFLAVLLFQRDSPVEGTDVTLAGLTLPGMIGLLAATGGFVGTAALLSSHREDGTLLRAKAVPDGMVGYLVGRIVQNSLDTSVSLAVILLPGLLVVAELRGAGPGGWLLLLLVLALGLVATLPWGALAGAVTRTPQGSFGITMLPIMALTSVSGIFYPISALPGWLQAVGQLFPVYWLGLGTRAALLPDSAAAAEPGGSWRHLETFGVLGAWAVAGLLLAPPVLRRMARRESGSDLAERRRQALQRGAN